MLWLYRLRASLNAIGGRLNICFESQRFSSSVLFLRRTAASAGTVPVLGTLLVVTANETSPRTFLILLKL